MSRTLALPTIPHGRWAANEESHTCLGNRGGLSCRLRLRFLPSPHIELTSDICPGLHSGGSLFAPNLWLPLGDCPHRPLDCCRANECLSPSAEHSNPRERQLQELSHLVPCSQRNLHLRGDAHRLLSKWHCDNRRLRYNRNCIWALHRLQHTGVDLTSHLMTKIGFPRTSLSGVIPSPGPVGAFILPWCRSGAISAMLLVT